MNLYWDDVMMMAMRRNDDDDDGDDMESIRRKNLLIVDIQDWMADIHNRTSDIHIWFIIMAINNCIMGRQNGLT